MTRERKPPLPHFYNITLGTVRNSHCATKKSVILHIDSNQNMNYNECNEK